MTTHRIDPLDPQNPLLTEQTLPQDTNQPTPQTKAPKRIKVAQKDKSHFAEFTERTNWQGERMLLKRCQAWKKHTDQTIQCNGIACVNRGYNICQYHGAGKGIGKRTAAGEASRIASITTHGELTKVAVEKKQRRVKTERALKKLAYAIGESEYDVRGKNLQAYPKPSLMDAVDLIAKLVEQG
jgi:hypothetical protein